MPKVGYVQNFVDDHLPSVCTSSGESASECGSNTIHALYLPKQEKVGNCIKYMHKHAKKTCQVKRF